MYLVIKLCNTLASLEEESADKSRLDSKKSCCQYSSLVVYLVPSLMFDGRGDEPALFVDITILQNPILIRFHQHTHAGAQRNGHKCCSFVFHSKSRHAVHIWELAGNRRRLL